MYKLQVVEVENKINTHKIKVIITKIQVGGYRDYRSENQNELVEGRLMNYA
jgi:hypothetical protein